MAGILALVGAGEFLETMSGVDRQLLERAGGSKVVIIPTASAPDGPGVPERWIQQGVDHFTRLGANPIGVRALDRAECNDPHHVERVREADLVYFSGGKPDYLHATLAGTGLWSAVEAVLDRGGVVAGCSAGAMIMGGYVPEFTMRLGVPFIRRWQTAFGLVPGAIIAPHYNEFPEVMVNVMFGRRPHGTFLIGVDAHTALIGLNGTWQASGAGRVTVQQGRTTQRYTPGQAVSLTS